MTALADLARDRGVTRLIHFTPGRNLPHIIDDGALRPAAELGGDEHAHFTVTDQTRRDGFPDRTCCSIEFPNPYYLRQAQGRPDARPYPDWVALLLTVDLLDRPGSLLSQRNAAAGTAVPANRSSFQALYAPRVQSHRVYQRSRMHLPEAPTDMQAEALIPRHIDLSQVAGLLFPSMDMLRDVRAHLNQIGRTPPTHWRWLHSPEAFDADRLRRCIYRGIRPEEHEHA